MDKLEFQLPNKLIIPSMYFFISNHLASVIKVQEKTIVYEFDPRGFGLLSDKVINTLNDIKHPIEQLGDKKVDYSMTLDQNLLNSLFIEMSTIHKEFSLRYWASFFDRKAQYISMLNTNILVFNMPSLTREYGHHLQFDVVSMIDQDTFLQKKQNSKINGFSIDQSGHVTGTLNLISYLKVAPEDVEVKPNAPPKKRKEVKAIAAKSEDGEDDDSAEEDDDDIADDSLDSDTHDAWLKNMTDTWHWQIARTIYTSLEIKGQIEIKDIGNGEQQLLLAINKLDVAKLDFHKGSPQEHKVGREKTKTDDDEEFDEIVPEPNKPKDDDDDDDEDDDDDDDKGDDSLTSEGGLIQALLRMQIQPRIKHWLPEFKHIFSDDLKMSGAFDCYGIHPGVPKLDFFKGGFILAGMYKEVPISEQACQDLPTNGIDFMSLQFAPEILRSKVN